MPIDVNQEKISDIADSIQQEMHKCIESVMDKKQNENSLDKPLLSVNTKGEVIVGGKLLYQDVANVFLIRKLAELTEEINQLKSQLKKD